MLPTLPPPLIAFGLLGLVTTPLVFYDARQRGNAHPHAWAIFTLVTFGHGGLVYLLDRNDPGERPEQDGEFMLPGTDPPGDNGDAEE